jgi:hypothetical protein
MADEFPEEPVNEEESPRDRFRRLATTRVNEILKRLKILGNCANRRNYEYDIKDVYKIFDEIEKKVQQTKSKFLDAKEQEFKI